MANPLDHPLDHLQERPRQPRLGQRFLQPELRARSGPRQLFGEGPWAALRVQLEREGWNPMQIELVHDQLRQGWHLAEAKRNAVRMSGSCPLQA